MYHTADEFLLFYVNESATTAKVLGTLTDASLALEKAAGHNTVGDIAWHIATAPVYMLNQVGFILDAALAEKPEQLTAAAIQATHAKLVEQVKAQAAKLTPADLAEVHHVFGMMDWPTATMLAVLLNHEIHHRGQLSVLVRQAGLVVPMIYGPTKEMSVEDIRKKMEGQG